MSLAPVSLVVGGATIPLSTVLADVTIRHGRVDVYDTPSPSTIQASITPVSHAYTKAFRVGASLVFNVSDSGGAPQPRFTGRVTDAALEDDLLTVIGVGRLASLAGVLVGGYDYPAEAWSARVTRIFTDPGFAAQLVLVPPPQDPQLAARDFDTEGAVDLSQYLNALADMVGAAIADLPDGRILVQAIAARTLAGQIALDPAEVAFTPVWAMVLPLANDVTVTWPPAGTVTQTDANSVGYYGRRPVTIDTEFAVPADATARANERLARSAAPHWNIPSAPLLVGRVLPIGSPLTLTGMPAPSPYTTWTPVLEGWQDTIQSDGIELEWTMELALSDPLASGLTLPWTGVPTTAGYHWDTINQTVAWQDALQLGDLTP